MLTKLLKYVTLGVAVSSCGVEEPGCSTDHDCKGERVCVQGECVGGTGNSNGSSGGNNLPDSGNKDYCGLYANSCLPFYGRMSTSEVEECRNDCNYEAIGNSPEGQKEKGCMFLLCVVETGCPKYRLDDGCDDPAAHNRLQFAQDHPALLSCFKERGIYYAPFWNQSFEEACDL